MTTTSPSASEPPKWLVVVTIIAVAAGAYFRLTNLGTKVYWHDETWTSLHLSGRQDRLTRPELLARGQLTAGELRQYQLPAPGSSVWTVFKALAEDDPKHPPLYFVFCRLWVDAFGSSVASVRAVSAGLSLLALPCLYWLCMELFDRRRSIALTAVAMMALAPVHVLYGQEAREYSLWTLSILLSSVALVAAVRKNTWPAWALYALTAIIGIYSFTLFGLVQVAHTVYIAAVAWLRVREGGSWHLPRIVTGFVVASIASFVIFTPWLWQIIEARDRLERMASWLTTGGGPIFLVKRWIAAVGSLVVDLHPEHRVTITTALGTVLVAAIGLAGWIGMSRQAKVFTAAMLAIPTLALAIPDLLGGGVRSAQPRYLMPAYVAVGLAVAFAIGSDLEATKVSRSRRLAAAGTLMLLLIAGAASCGLSARAECWWNKPHSAELPPIARALGQQTRPLLIVHMSTVYTGTLLTLSHYLDPNTELLLHDGNGALHIPEGHSAVFVLVDPQRLLEAGTQPGLASRLKGMPPFKSLMRIEGEDGENR